MLENLTWKDASEVFKQAQIALVPVGSTEQHGPHLPLGTDHLIAAAIAEEAAKRGGFIATPVVSVGVSDHHRQFFGTLWVPSVVLKEYLRGIARSLKYHGIERIIFVNGHGGNTLVIQECCRELREEGITTLLYEWWHAAQELIEELFEKPAGHADEVETSMMMAIAPQLVHAERLAEAEEGAAETWGITRFGTATYFDTIDFSASGTTGRPTRASAEKGRRVFEAACDTLIQLGQWFAETEDLAEKPHKD